MAGKTTPCITLMLCVAGCSSTTSGTLPHSRTLPPPNFDVNGVPARSTAPVWDEKPAKSVAGAPQTPLPTAKPVTVDVPIKAFAEKPPSGPVLATQFQSVPDSYLSGALETPVKKQAFFTPLSLPPATSPAAEENVVDANAILGLLIADLPPDSVVVPEPIPYPQYVSVGPEYFGYGSDIAPYVVDPAEQSPQPNKEYAHQDPVALRPQWPVVAADEEAGGAFPIPQRRPSRHLPEQPAREIQTVAIVPPRPMPSPQRVPSEPAPRAPARTTGERVSTTIPRDDVSAGSRVSAILPRAKPIREPDPVTPEATAEAPQYRVRLEPETASESVVASLDIETSTLPPLLPELSVVTSDDLAGEKYYTPMPRRKPPQRASVRFAGAPSTITPATIATQPANDSAAASGCLVSRGSNERMILICEGIDVPQANVFRAVVEGESAFRELRPFDPPDNIVSTYGFNAERFHAMSQGPRSARDLAFLRALRKSGKSIRVKGRDFEMYLMKGDNNLATVLVEQVVLSQPLNAVGQ